MRNRQILRLHWKLYFPLVGLLWLIIGITMCYFVTHESERQKNNLENRLLNVNNTVIEAYEKGANLQNTVDFIRLFTDHTTLTPLRITVYDNKGNIIADNPEATINIYDENGKPNGELIKLLDDSEDGNVTIIDMIYGDHISMISSKASNDGKIYSLAALPYQGEVLAFLSIDPMVWVVVLILAIFASVLAFFGVKAVCKNVYALKDFTQAIADDVLPEDTDFNNFSNDELGDVSRNLLSVYREKLHAQQEKIHHERQICMNVSHELKTPVGIIKGYVDTIVNDPDLPEETKAMFFTRIQQNIDRLSGLVTDVGMVMRLEENNTIKCSEIDLHNLTVKLGEDISQSGITQDMVFRHNIPDGCKVIGHESLLTNVLLNLVSNAAKYSGGTEMSLEWLGEYNGFHMFSFSDNGTGVDEKHLNRLFDLFYRVDTGRSRKSGGTGLGLPLVQRVIRAIGGDIKVENVSTGGLRFIFTIPAAK